MLHRGDQTFTQMAPVFHLDDGILYLDDQISYLDDQISYLDDQTFNKVLHLYQKIITRAFIAMTLKEFEICDVKH